MKSKCPCCNYYSLNTKDPLKHEICQICFWENDPIQNDDEFYAGGANEMCLYQAKQNYINYGAISFEYTKYVREPRFDENKDK